VSKQNVELVRGLQPGPAVDVAAMFRDDAVWAGIAEASVSLFHPDFESIMHGASAATYTGGEGFRAAWLDWLAPAADRFANGRE